MQAQEPVSIHLSEKDGVPDKEFYDIIEDSKGFIWLCADKGLFRYDGKIFKKYTNAKQRGLSLFNANEDHLGRIWSNNISGQFFYVQDDKLHLFLDLSKELKGELANYAITKGFLWVFCMRKVYKVNLKTKAVKNIRSEERFITKPLKYKDLFHFSNQDSIFNISKNHRVKSLLSTKLPYLNEKGKTISQGKSTMFKIGNRLFLRDKRNGKVAIFQYTIATKEMKAMKGLEAIAKEFIYYEFENENEAWFATRTGVWVYELLENGFKLKSRFLKNKKVTKVLKDKDDNYWLITLNSGIYIIPNINIESSNIPEANKNISAIDKINDYTFVFGTANGNVGVYNILNNSTSMTMLPTRDRVSTLKYHQKTNSIIVSKDEFGFLLKFKNSVLESSSLDGLDNIKSISILENNDLLLADNNSVRIINNTSLNIEEKNVSSGQRAYASLYNKKAKAVYIAYINNLLVYDSLWNNKVITYKNRPIYVNSITQTTNDMLWVSTFKDGIFSIKNNKVVNHFNISNGLTSNNIQKVKGDGNNLWIVSDNSIQLLDTSDDKIKTLTKGDGIKSFDISGIEILNDKVFFSSNEGVFSIDKEKSFKTLSPKVYFNKLEVNEVVMPLISKLKLEHNQNTIKIGFNVNGFQFNQKGKFAYRLLGINKDWIATDTGTNSVKYNSLPSGKYTFQVRPLLDLDDGESNIEILEFSIRKPFWKTWWFILGVSILIFGTTILYFRSKIKNKELESNKQLKKLSLDNELVALKLENLRSQMNPHFIFNALNSIQEYIVLNKKRLASDYLGKFADLIRTYLNHSTKGKITLQEEIDCLDMYLELEKLRFEDKLHYTIATSGILKPDDVDIPTMLIQPYVENALKHGLLHRKTNRVLEINFFINANTNIVKCIIIDNGVGREKAEKFKARSHKNHKSFATKATEDRLTLLNYGKEKQIGVAIIDLYDEGLPIGTQVNISIPYTNH